MGIRYRKSVNVGPFRVNASKTGFGWSVGGPGGRYTKMANGRTRVTASVPGTGISWVKETKKQPIEPEIDEELRGWPLFWKDLGKFLLGVLVVGVFVLSALLAGLAKGAKK